MKTMKIEIKRRKEANQELFHNAKNFDLKKGQKFKTRGTFFESLAAVRGVLTDKRLEVWRMIRDVEPKTITDLSKRLDRNFRAVHRDVLLLEKIGLITLTEEQGKRGKSQRATSNYDELLLAVS